MKRRVLAPPLILIAALVAWWLAAGSDGKVSGLHAERPVASATAPASASIAAPAPEASPEPARAAAEVPEREAVIGEVEPLPFAGRCLDRSSGDPLAELRVKATGTHDWTAAWTKEDGSFRVRRAIEPPLRFAILDLGTELEVPEEDVRLLDDGSFEIAVDAGPTYFLELTGAGELPELDRLEVALHEDVPGLAEPRVWSSRGIRDPYGKPWIRFTRREHEVSPAAVGTLVARTSTGTLEARAVVATTVGVQREPVRLHLDLAGAVAVGRVVDRNGEPASGTRVVAIPLDEHGREFGHDRWSHSRTRDDGTYAIANLEPGRHRIVAERLGSCPGHGEVVLERGPTRVDDISIETRPARGEISGSIIAPAGSVEPFAVLRLRSEDGCGLTQVAFVGGILAPRGPSFEFEAVPDGLYRLTLHSIDGREYSPHSIEVSPPISGLVFTTETTLADLQHAGDLTLEVYDEESGREIPQFEVLLGNDRRWLPGAILSGFGRAIEGNWNHRAVVHARGYRPKLVADTRSVAGAPRDVKVRLQRGFGVTLLVRAAAPTTTLTDFTGFGQELVSLIRTPLAGVRAQGGSGTLGISDDLGLLIVSAAERPDTLELVHERYATQRGLEPDLETPFQVVLMQPR